MTTPNLGLSEVASNSLQPSVPINESLQALDALVQGRVQDKDLTTPPTTVSGDVGKLWIVAAGATGAWASHDGELALCTAATVWRFFTPLEGWRFDVIDEDAQYRYDGSAWVEVTGGDTSTNVNDETASYTAVLSDQVVVMDSASANNFTVPAEATVDYPVGWFLEVWQKGAGQTTIVADTGVTILYHSDLTLKLKGQNSGCSLRKVAADTWRLIGDMEAA